ncbi:MAG TPA: hypothetical protein VFC03_07475 [Acidimicrobiales bacterium]|nr:hypothetical protein [Acidimicrobiales bacterium]
MALSSTSTPPTPMLMSYQCCARGFRVNLSVCARSSPGSRNQFPEVSLVSTEGLGIFGRLASAVSTPVEN